MRIFNGLHKNDIVIYEKDMERYQVVELIKEGNKSYCKIIQLKQKDKIYKVPVELCIKES